jgi:hypothetical protein
MRISLGMCPVGLDQNSIASNAIAVTVETRNAYTTKR